MEELTQHKTETAHTLCGLSSTQSAFALGDWKVSPASNEIADRSGKALIALEPRLMQLLCMLNEQADTVVTRDKLCDGLWPHVVVNENSLTRAVSSLRKKLKPLHGQTALIETIPKRGYRLNTNAIEATALNAANCPDSEQENGLARFGRFCTNNWVKTSAMSLSLSLGIATALLSGLDSNTEIAAPTLLGDTVTTQKQFAWEGSQTRVENAVAQEPSSAPSSLSATVFSHDGSFFAYIKQQQDTASIMLGSIEEPDMTYEVFSTHDSIEHLQWAPTKQALLFAQSPKFSPAVLNKASAKPSLVMLDLETLNTRVLDGPEIKTQEGPTNNTFDIKPFNLT